MAQKSTRFFFIFALCVNLLILSRGRYGQPLDSRAEPISRVTLFKRISDEFGRNDGITVYEEGETQCRPLQFPAPEQCKHVIDQCPRSETLLSIQYLRRYYCAEPKSRPLVFTGLIVWLVFLFSTLGISASDFFTPNLASIAHLLGLDENVAGVTFLAFGNGSPDVFSTFSAMRANSGGLAIGELIGAATFIVSCVVGSMCIIKPFKVHPRPFLRDVGFFTVAVSLMLVILWDGWIHLWEAGLLIFLYLVYVCVVVLSSWWERRQERRRAREALIRSEYQDDGNDFERYTDEPSYGDLLNLPSPGYSRGRAVSAPNPPRLQTNLPQPSYHSRSPSPSSSITPRHPQLPSFSLIGALEFRDVIASLQREASTNSLGIFESPITPYAGGHYHHHRRPSRSSLRTGAEEELDGGLPLDTRTRPHSPVSPTPQRHSRLFSSASEPLDYFSGSSLPVHASIPSILRTPASPTVSERDEVLYTPLTHKQRVLQAFWEACHILFPTLHQIRDQSILGAIACIVAAPAILLLTLTLPVVVPDHHDSHKHVEKVQSSPGDAPLIEFEEEGVERVLIAEEEVEEEMHKLAYNKWLMAAQCVFGPLFCVTVLFDATSLLLVAALVGGLALATSVISFSDDGENVSGKIMRCSMGFLVAIVWIMAIADEVVDVLRAVGIIFGLSDAIIGLTIFAMGNSLADLVANMSVAVFAPIMGFSACFGGPMLNILLGVGLAGTTIMQKTQQPYHLELSNSLFVSSISLLVILAATLIFVPLNDFYLSRRWGVLLIIAYVVIMTINVVVELRT